MSFNLDEYIGLSSGDINTFRFYMNHYLGEPLNLNNDQLRVPNGQAKNPQNEAFSYGNDLKNMGGLGIQLLGLGVNGHIGFNEPPCAKDDACRVVELSLSTRLQNAVSFNNNYTQVPKSAITLGIKEIIKAQEIHLIVTGQSKADILASLLHLPCSEDLPASWLRLHPRVFLWADFDAYQKVTS